MSLTAVDLDDDVYVEATVDLDDDFQPLQNNSTKPEAGQATGQRQLTDVKVAAYGKHKISYSKYNSLYQCPKKFYAEHIQSPKTAENNEDNHRAFIGIITQYIFERITNDRLYKDYTYDEFCAVIDSDLKKLKPFILELDKQTEYIDNQQLFVTGGVIVDQSPRTLVQTSEKYKIFIAQNSIIKKIRDHYKKPLKTYLDFNLDDFKCEVKLSAPYKDRIFKGTIDFLEVKSDSIRIIDGKKKKTIDPKTGETLHNKTQLMLYKFLAEANFHKSVAEVAYFYYEENLYETVKLDDQITDFLDEACAAFDRVESYTEADQFEVTPSYINCMFCPLSGSCNHYTNKKG
jgi:CRISPR/Cas system-associated exonuclease Cas4 (RecB family)